MEDITFYSLQAFFIKYTHNDENISNKNLNFKAVWIFYHISLMAHNESGLRFYKLIYEVHPNYEAQWVV
jgi:hypothetical protein